MIANSRYTLDVLTGTVARLRAPHGRRPQRGAAAAGSPPRTALDAPLRLLYVGRLRRARASTSRSPRPGSSPQGVDVRLDLVGAAVPGAEWFERDLRESVRSEGLDATVAFHGYDPDPWTYAAAADVVLVPSRLEESFGNTAVEAGLAHRPVVVSDTSGLREAASGLGSAVLVRPRTPWPSRTPCRDRRRLAALSAAAVEDAPALAGATTSAATAGRSATSWAPCWRVQGRERRPVAP